MQTEVAQAVQRIRAAQRQAEPGMTMDPAGGPFKACHLSPVAAPGHEPVAVASKGPKRRRRAGSEAGCSENGRPRTLVCGASRHVKGSLRRALPALDLATSHIQSRSSRGIACHVRTFAVHFIRETTMVKQDTLDTTRDARLEARVSAAQKNLLQQAAALSGRTLSEFVVASAQDAARRVLAEHESIRLSREQQLAFVQALLNPPEPNARLKRAAKAYRQRVGS